MQMSMERVQNEKCTQSDFSIRLISLRYVDGANNQSTDNGI